MNEVKIQPLKKRHSPMASLAREVNWHTDKKPYLPEKEKNSSLSFGLISDERLYRGLAYEGDMHYLTQENWRVTLKYTPLDFVMIESSLETATGDWQMALTDPSFENTELFKLINYAKEKNIPTIYWFTLDHEYHELFSPISKYFDYVFCADPKEIELMKDIGIDAEILLPAFQPAIYNKFTHLHETEKTIKKKMFLFDGWVDFDKYKDDFDYIKEITKYDLVIYESESNIDDSRKTNIAPFDNFLYGKVSFKDKLELLKNANIYLMDANTTKTKTTQVWLALEAVACGLTVMYRGSLPKNYFLKKFIFSFANLEGYFSEIYSQIINGEYRDRLSHLIWRYVNHYHTFSDRLETICNKIQVDSNLNKYPLVSIVSPTIRPENIDNILKNFKIQTYPNLELIIVCNGFESVNIHYEENIKVATIAQDLYAGAALNRGIELAKGKYVFRLDDDDIYGKNYILDMILGAQPLDFDLFGKSPCPLKFEDEVGVYKSNNIKEYIIIESQELQKKKIWLGGNTFAGKRTFFQELRFDNKMFGSADSEFLSRVANGRIAMLDSKNVLAVRSNDLHSHTWKATKESLVSKRAFDKYEEGVFI